MELSCLSDGVVHTPLPSLIRPEEAPPEGEYFRRFENFQWAGQYLEGVQKMVSFKDSYSLFRCFPHILGIGYGDEFHDTRGN